MIPNSGLIDVRRTFCWFCYIFSNSFWGLSGISSHTSGLHSPQSGSPQYYIHHHAHLAHLEVTDSTWNQYPTGNLLCTNLFSIWLKPQGIFASMSSMDLKQKAIKISQPWGISLFAQMFECWFLKVSQIFWQLCSQGSHIRLKWKKQLQHWSHLMNVLLNFFLSKVFYKKIVSLTTFPAFWDLSAEMGKKYRKWGLNIILIDSFLIDCFTQLNIYLIRIW